MPEIISSVFGGRHKKGMIKNAVLGIIVGDTIIEAVLVLACSLSCAVRGSSTTVGTHVELVGW